MVAKAAMDLANTFCAGPTCKGSGTQSSQPSDFEEFKVRSLAAAGYLHSPSMALNISKIIRDTPFGKH